MSREQRLIDQAVDASFATEDNCAFKIGAVVARGNRLLSKCCCKNKTHPQNPKILKKSKRRQLCAEVGAIFKALALTKKRDLRGCDMYVARRRRGDDSLAMAKPCQYCQYFMKKYGIRRVIYTTGTGTECLYL